MSETTATSREARADALLDAIKSEGQQRLKVFLGAAPGVGKTWAMLSAARELKKQGVDVVVGLVETHGRAETAALLQGLEVLSRRRVKYRDRDFEEFDLDAALARKPAVMLVDELAHTNLPGVRHEQRWQDVAELLDAGIEIYTTLNVQHLESLNDQVRRITNVTVRERVPDTFLDRARDIVLVDLPPRELIQRLTQGKVYVPETAAAALDAFFTPTNLASLRELAVEVVAGHVESDLRGSMRARGAAMPVRRRVMAAIDGGPQSEYLVRLARRVAERRGGTWSAVFVDTGVPLEPTRHERMEGALRLARQLGGEGELLRGHAISEELLAYTGREGVAQVILGRTRERWFARTFGRTLTQQLLRHGAHLEITIVATPAERAAARRSWRLPHLPGGLGRRGEYVLATLTTLMALGLAFISQNDLSVANLSLIFLTAVLIVAVRTRMAVAIYTAALCFVADNFFFMPPVYSLQISSPNDVLTISLFSVAALICSQMATRLGYQVRLLRSAHARSRALSALGQRLATSADAQSIRSAGATALAQALHCETGLLARDTTDALQVAAAVPPGMRLQAQDLAAADWCDRHGAQAGRYTDTLTAAPCWILPLGSEDKQLGAVALRFPTGAGELDPDHRSLALAMVQDVGEALARAQLAQELESARLQSETERLRNALLASVSHDLRSPLASMIGAAGTLAKYAEQLLTSERRELLASILAEGQRLDRYIENLLDMARLGHGTLTLDRDWTDVAEIVAAAVTRLRKLLPTVHVVTTLPPNMLLLYVHPALIEQALFNILENAARFSPPKQPVLVSARTFDDSLLIEVSDRGPGIPETERERIFDMFYTMTRGDRAKPGTGLGLAICRGMIGAHGGSVEALPRESGGTTIRITLPLSSEAPDTDASA